MKKSTNTQQNKRVITTASHTVKPELEEAAVPVKEKIDPKKLIIYSEIMSPKFKD